MEQLDGKTVDWKAYSAASATSPLASTTIPRRDPTERDVLKYRFSIDMASLKSE